MIMELGEDEDSGVADEDGVAPARDAKRVRRCANGG